MNNCIGATLSVVSASLLTYGCQSQSIWKLYSNNTTVAEVKYGVGSQNYGQIYSVKFRDSFGTRWIEYNQSQINDVNANYNLTKPTYDKYREDMQGVNKKSKENLKQSISQNDKMQFQALIDFTNDVEKSYKCIKHIP